MSGLWKIELGINDKIIRKDDQIHIVGKVEQKISFYTSWRSHKYIISMK